MLKQNMNELADELYRAGYRDARSEKSFDPRGCQEWQAVVDATRPSAASAAVDERVEFEASDFYREYAVAGMPKDKQRLAFAAWQARAALIKDGQP